MCRIELSLAQVSDTTGDDSSNAARHINKKDQSSRLVFEYCRDYFVSPLARLASELKR